MAYEWNSFLWSADQWIIAYSAPPLGLIAVKLFAVGHALELYLKACVARALGDVGAAIQMGHNVTALWSRCKVMDSAFLPTWELRPAVLAVNVLNHDDYSQLPRGDLMHFLDHQELYVVAKHLPDIKYIGAPFKTVKGAFGIVVVSHNPMWAGIFKDLRQYLSYPQTSQLDQIRDAVKSCELPIESVQYLASLLT